MLLSSPHHKLHPQSSNLTRAGEPLYLHGVPLQSITFDQPQGKTSVYQFGEIRPRLGNTLTPVEQKAASVQK